MKSVGEKPLVLCLLEIISSGKMDQKDSSYMKDLVYGSGADVTLKFNDGKKINVNRSILAAKHKAFFKLLFVDKSSDIIEISDYSAELFQLFLDCLMGFKKRSKKNILEVFPIAFKYGIEEFIAQWLEFSKSEDVNKDLCLSFNMAVSHKMEHLVKSVVELLKTDAKIYKLLERDDLCSLLEPKSMLVLLNNVEMDSWVYNILFKWARNYLRDVKTINLKVFFHSFGFSNLIYLENFETVESILEFHRNGPGKDYFTDEEILDYIKKRHFTNICDSQWIKVKRGDFVDEVFHFENLFLGRDCALRLNIHRNNAVFYEWPQNEIFCPINYVLLWESFTLGEKPAPKSCLKVFHEHIDKNSVYGGVQVMIKNIKEEFVLTKIKIKYLFKVDCRILKTAPKLNKRIRCDNDKENLCFTRNISFQYA